MATHQEKQEQNKKNVLKAIKFLGRVPISRITGYLGMDYNYVVKCVDELAAEKKIIKEVETNATYVRENVKAANKKLQ